MKRKSYWVAFSLLMGSITNQAALACSSEDYIGSICVTAATFCPNGTVEADGRELAVSQNSTLFSLIGYVYGGNASKQTFNLPDLQGRTPVGSGRNSDTGTKVDVGQKRGQEFVTLTVNQLAAHTHAATFNPSGTNPISVNIPVSANTASNKLTPDRDFSYIAGTPNGGSAAAMWSNTLTNPINIKGVTTSVGGTGTITIAPTGTNAPVATIPPQLGLRYCIVVTGQYPPRD